jgi:NAD(P) transhydrogenase subunit beta
MPILDADKTRTIIILKRSLAPGFSGEDNELFYDPKTMMVFGDAKATLITLVQLLKKEQAAHQQQTPAAVPAASQ